MPISLNRLRGTIIGHAFHLLVKRFYRTASSFFYTAFIASFVFVLFTVRPFEHASAIESPQQYFDYNTYQSPQVLGVSAQEPADDTAQREATPAGNELDHKDLAIYQGYLFGAKFAPDNPLYPLKRMQESVSLAFTRNPEKRAKLLLSLGSARAKEIEAMAEEGKTAHLPSLASSYEKTMQDNGKILETLKDKLTATPLLLEIDKEASKHLLTFEEVSAKVPLQSVAQIDKALTGAEHIVDKVADVAGRPAVPQDLVARLAGYKAQGLLSEEEVSKIVGALTREEARSEFRKLAENRIVSLADVKKFDEAARSYYPAGFAKALEIRKFKELKDLETQKPDDATVDRIQEFAKNYKSGDVVPAEIRQWWAPMVRLEELQATFRPDLLEAAAYFKYRPEEQQKYNELVERMKPTEKDMTYVRDLIARNPEAANDPSYARILTIGQRFGTADKSPALSPAAASCSRDSHWVNVPFMPGGGYCVPDLVYQSLSAGTAGGDHPCPPNYHRAQQGGACYPDNPSGPGIINYLPAVGSCPSGYRWQTDRGAGRGGYCAPDYITGSGGYPSPFTPPQYCPQGKVFREGKCEDYNPPPREGCPAKSWWNGQKCVESKDCGQGRYQDSNGECRSTQDEFKKYESLCKDRPIPPGGCGGGYWDQASCQCRSTFDPRPAYYPQSTGDGGRSMEENCRRAGCTWVGRNNACECQSGGGQQSGGGGGGTPSRESQEAACRSGGGRCVSWVNGACGCEREGGSGPPGGGSGGPTYGGGSYNPEEMCKRGGNCRWENNSCRCDTSSYGGGSSGVPPSCGSGYYWNGSSCAQSESQNNPTPQPPSTSPPTQPPPSNPPPAEQRPPENPPPAPPPAENPPPAPPPAENPPPAQ